jgi:hypothetical protein
MSTSALLRTLMANKCLLVSSHSNDQVLSLADGSWSSITVTGARGLAVNDSMIAVASSESLMYYLRSTGEFAGSIVIDSKDSHEIAYGQNGDVIVCASQRSSLVRQNLGVDEVIWTVPGVTAGTSDGRSWVNGVTLVNNVPKYVSVLGVSDTSGGWRDEAMAERGVIFDADTNTPAVSGLLFPHSPTVIDGSLWFCNSGHAQLCRWTPGDAAHTVVTQLPGWSRGILDCGTHILVGISQGRLTAFPNLTADLMAQPGIAVVDKNSGNVVEFEALDVQEVFDLTVADVALR